MEERIESTTIRLIEGDIWTHPVEVLVRSTSSELDHDDRLGALNTELAGLGPVAPGEVAVTHGGTSLAQWVVHAVGPTWQKGVHSEYLLLERVHQRALAVAAERKARRVSFAPIATEPPRNFPLDRAPFVVLSTIARFIHEHPDALDEVVLVVDEPEHFRIYRAIFEEVAATMVHT